MQWKKIVRRAPLSWNGELTGFLKCEWEFSRWSVGRKRVLVRGNRMCKHPEARKSLDPLRMCGKELLEQRTSEQECPKMKKVRSNTALPFSLNEIYYIHRNQLMISQSSLYWINFYHGVDFLWWERIFFPIIGILIIRKGFPGSSVLENPPANTGMQETWVWYLDQEDPMEGEMTTHISILAWKIPWAEETGRLQSMVSQRFGQD